MSCELFSLAQHDFGESLSKVQIKCRIDDRIASGVVSREPPNNLSHCWRPSDLRPNGENLIDEKCRKPTDDEYGNDHDKDDQRFSLLFLKHIFILFSSSDDVIWGAANATNSRR